MEAVRDLMTVRWPGVWFRLDAISWECEGSEASASARVRDLRKEGWNVERRRVEGTRVREYRVNGRAPLEPAKRKPRDSELDELRARLERVEAELAALTRESA